MMNYEYDVGRSKANCKNHKDEKNCLDIPQPSTILCIKFADESCITVDNDHKRNEESKEC